MRRTRLRKQGKSKISKLQRELWEHCKRVTRKKYGNVCYTCGATGLESSNWHTGHFLTKSTCSALMKYDLDNLRPQCYRCNIHLSGNWVAFEEHLKRDKGEDFPAELKRRNQETSGAKYDELFYQSKIDEYKLL